MINIIEVPKEKYRIKSIKLGKKNLCDIIITVKITYKNFS